MGFCMYFHFVLYASPIFLPTFYYFKLIFFFNFKFVNCDITSSISVALTIAMANEIRVARSYVNNV